MGFVRGKGQSPSRGPVSGGRSACATCGKVFDRTDSAVRCMEAHKDSLFIPRSSVPHDVSGGRSRCPTCGEVFNDVYSATRCMEAHWSPWDRVPPPGRDRTVIRAQRSAPGNIALLCIFASFAVASAGAMIASSFLMFLLIFIGAAVLAMAGMGYAHYATRPEVTAKPAKETREDRIARLEPMLAADPVIAYLDGELNPKKRLVEEIAETARLLEVAEDPNDALRLATQLQVLTARASQERRRKVT